MLQLSDLYDLDWESFQLAIELLRDWRIDRYYADQTDLFGEGSKRKKREPGALQAAD
jgi:negative regulator of replication initiation